MGIRDIIAIGKLMWNLVKNAKEFARLQEENPRLKAELAACQAERKRLAEAHQAEVAALKADTAKLASDRRDPTENWSVPDGYAVFSPQPGVTVYRFNPPSESTVAEHFLCPRCLHLWGNKLILQFKDAQMAVGKCPGCGSTYRFKDVKRPFF